MQLLTKGADIIDWLEAEGITNYDLVPDSTYRYVVDVRGNVDIKKNPAVKFNYIAGSFIGENIDDLSGAPHMCAADFFCPNNFLVTLIGSPRFVGGNFNCHNNKLTSLVGAPDKIEGHAVLSSNQLTNLEHITPLISGTLILDDNLISSYEYLPVESGEIHTKGNPLSYPATRLEIFAKLVEKDAINNILEPSRVNKTKSRL